MAKHVAIRHCPMPVVTRGFRRRYKLVSARNMQVLASLRAVWFDATKEHMEVLASLRSLIFDATNGYTCATTDGMLFYESK